MERGGRDGQPPCGGVVVEAEHQVEGEGDVEGIVEVGEDGVEGRGVVQVEIEGAVEGDGEGQRGLDRHAEVGNNALAARALGLADLVPFGRHGDTTIGFRGTFPDPVGSDELVRRCRTLFGQEPLLLGPSRPVRTLGIISGGAQRELLQAVDEGLDAYLTGEVSEVSLMS